MLNNNSAAVIESEPVSTTFPKVEPVNSVWVEWATLRSAMKAALICCSTDTTRQALNSILVEIDDRMVRLVSTDGHRLVQIDVALPIQTPTENRSRFNFQIPREDAATWVKLAPPKGYSMPLQAQIQLKGRDVSIETLNGAAKLRTVDAQFPPYDQIIPARRLIRDSDNDKIRRDTCPAVGINGKYLADVGAVAQLVTPVLTQAVTVEVDDNALGPIRFDMIDNQRGIETTLIQMPMRI
jgi:DNA polymerase III sliding clamp (beta) subunit (PCNA family)